MPDPHTIIIGSGQGGSALAHRLADQGQRVTLCERDHLGGSCPNYGCTPSKVLLASAHAAGAARNAAALGVPCDVRPDFPAVMRRVRDLRGQWRESAAKIAEKVEVLRGEARFINARTIECAGERRTAARIVIDTGTRPAVPPIDGLEDTPYLTNVSVWELEERPRRMAILGAGYIGLELGQAMARLGVEVTIIDKAERPMSTEEPEVGRLLLKAMEDDGVRFHLGAELQRVGHDGERFTIALDGGGTIEAESFLVAAGRTPNTDALDAEAADIELDDKGHIKIDDRFQTTAPGVWAIGDCANQPAFTHVSYEDHHRLYGIWNGENRTRDDRTLAYAVFTDPQVGRVGMTLDQAKHKGIDAIQKSAEYAKVARGREWNHTRGFFRLVADRPTGRLLGATIVGYEAPELVQMFVPLIQNGRTWRDVAESVFIHPTYGEAIMTVAEEFAE